MSITFLPYDAVPASVDVLAGANRHSSSRHCRMPMTQNRMECMDASRRLKMVATLLAEVILEVRVSPK